MNEIMPRKPLFTPLRRSRQAAVAQPDPDPKASRPPRSHTLPGAGRLIGSELT